MIGKISGGGDVVLSAWKVKALQTPYVYLCAVSDTTDVTVFNCLQCGQGWTFNNCNTQTIKFMRQRMNAITVKGQMPKIPLKIKKLVNFAFILFLSNVVFRHRLSMLNNYPHSLV